MLSEPDGKLMVLVIADTNTLIVYEGSTIKWSAQLPFAPVTAARVQLQVSRYSREASAHGRSERSAPDRSASEERRVAISEKRRSAKKGNRSARKADRRGRLSSPLVQQGCRRCLFREIELGAERSGSDSCAFAFSGNT